MVDRLPFTRQRGSTRSDEAHRIHLASNPVPHPHIRPDQWVISLVSHGPSLQSELGHTTGSFYTRTFYFPFTYTHSAGHICFCHLSSARTWVKNPIILSFLMERDPRKLHGVLHREAGALARGGQYHTDAYPFPNCNSNIIYKA